MVLHPRGCYRGNILQNYSKQAPIQINNAKSNIELLEGNKLSIEDKINLITDNTPKQINIMNGGLMDSFLFNFPLD